MAFFSLFLMKKTLSSGQKWFLRSYFQLIWGIFFLGSGLRFSFPAPEVRKRPFSLTKVVFLTLGSGISVLQNENLRPFLIQMNPQLVGYMASETTFG